MQQLNISVPKPAWERGEARAPRPATDPPLLPDKEMRGPDHCKGPQGAGTGAGAKKELEGRAWPQLLRMLVSHATELAGPRGNRKLAKDSAGKTGVKCVLKEQ